MKKLIFILSIVTLVSCSKSETKETENPMTLKVTMLTDYGHGIIFKNTGTDLPGVKNIPIKVIETCYGDEQITFITTVDTDYKIVEFEWQGMKQQIKFRTSLKVLVTLSKGSFTLKCI